MQLDCFQTVDILMIRGKISSFICEENWVRLWRTMNHGSSLPYMKAEVIQPKDLPSSQ